MSAEENKAIVRKLNDEVWNKGNLSAIDELVSPDYVVHETEANDDSIFGQNKQAGPEGVKQAAWILRTAFPDVQMTFDDLVAEGDRVVLRWTARATHSGPLGRIPPTGKRATVTGVWIDRLAGGKVVEEWQNWDLFGLLMQLGVIPAPAPTAERSQA